MTKRGAFHVDEPYGQRWILALDHLLAGGQVLFAGMVLYLEQDGPHDPRPSSPLVIELAAPPWWREGMSEKAAALMRAELGAARERLRLAAAASPSFAELLDRREPVIHLVDDYGTGTIQRASVSTSGAVVWD